MVSSRTIGIQIQAIITLFRVDALTPDSEIVNGIVRYLESHDISGNFFDLLWKSNTAV